MNYADLLEFAKKTNTDPKIINAIETLRIELCIKCGKYRNSHLGACNGCQWEG